MKHSYKNMENKKTVHFVPTYFLRPVHPITVCLVGAGGNGSQMLSALCRIDHALRAIGDHPGLNVTVFDPDKVEPSNIGRQLFTQGDLGQNKAECLVTRFNRCFGTRWTARDRKFEHDSVCGSQYPNIIITCVDNIDARKKIGKLFRAWNIKPEQDSYSTYAMEHRAYYWLDLGNAQKTGQAILGSNYIRQPETKEYETTDMLPTITEQFDLSKIKEKDSGPSCSMAEALTKQDLFINSVLVQNSASLLWSLLTDMAIDTRGMFVNVDTYQTVPVRIQQQDKLLISKPKQKK